MNDEEKREDFWEGFSVSDFISDYSSRAITETELSEDNEKTFLRSEINNLPKCIVREVFSEQELKELNV